MSSAGIALRQVSFEQKSFWRNPASAFFAFLFPIIFLVVFSPRCSRGSRCWSAR